MAVCGQLEVELCFPANFPNRLMYFFFFKLTSLPKEEEGLST